MSNYWPDASLQTNLSKIKTDRLDGCLLRLVKANVADASGNVAATYTAQEADFGGYAAITLNSWGAVISGGTGIGETDETIRTFTATGASLPQSIYGVFLTDPAGLLIYAEMFPTGPIVLSAAGHTVNYKPIAKDAR